MLAQLVIEKVATCYEPSSKQRDILTTTQHVARSTIVYMFDDLTNEQCSTCSTTNKASNVRHVRQRAKRAMFDTFDNEQSEQYSTCSTTNKASNV